jgi:hypothetical protein
MTPAPASVNIGSVPLGQQGHASLVLTNDGNLPATITAAGALPAPFGITSPVDQGLPVNPGYDLDIPVTFSPASTGAVATTFQVGWTDAAGRHTLRVPVSGTGVAAAAGRTAVSPPGGGWTLNGSARMSGSSLVLTPAAAGQAGSAVYPVPEASGGLDVTFTAHIGGGTGGDGMTFSMLDAATQGPGALGGDGGNLGFGGLPGAAVTLDTRRNPGDPSANFIGIATGSAGGQVTYLATTSTGVPNLRAGSHVIGVRVSGRTITVSVDGQQDLSAALSLPPTVLLAFTGATGNATDTHTVSGAAVTVSGDQVPPPGGGWSFNGAAGMAGSDTELTQAVAGQAGAAVSTATYPAAGLHAQFDAQLGGGTGADGLTFALLNPASATAASLGDAAGLGFGGLSGVAVTLDTYRDAGYPSANFAAISLGRNSHGLLAFQVYVRAIAPLRTGTHIVTVSVTAAGGTDVLIVALDGQQILQHAEPRLSRMVRLAFTSGTTRQTDVHTVRDVAISTAA